MASRYCRPSDIVTSSATVTVAEGTESTDAHYQRASLYDRDPAVPMKFTTADAARLVFDFGSAQQIQAAFIPQHNFEAGLAVRLQGNTAASWGSPAFDAVFTISAKDRDGHVKRPWLNLSVLSPSYRYWSLLVPSGSVAPQIGEAILVETLRQFVRPLTFGVSRVVARGYIASLETEYGVKSFYDQNVKQWKYVSAIYGTTADLQSMHDLMDDCHGPVYPFAFVLDDSVESDGGCYVRCSEAMCQAWEHKKVGGGTYEMPLEFEELSRGLPL
jgi:hypothetical protein